MVNLRRTWWVIRRHAYVLWRSPHRWFDIAFWPFMDIVLWGSLGVFVARQDEASQAATPFLVGGILMFHVLFQSQIAVATGFMEETWSRNLLNVMTTPVTEVEYVLGTAAFGLVKVLAALATIDRLDLDDYHLFHATRADLLRRLDRPAEAADAFAAAIALTANAAERRFLEGRRRALGADSVGPVPD